MMYSTGKDSIVKAKINDNIVIIDLASRYRDSYDDIPREKEYLGKGVYYSCDNQLSTDTKEYHFWKYKKENQTLNAKIPEPEFNNNPTPKKQLTKLEAQTLLFQTMLQMSNRELESVLYYLDNGTTTSGFEVTEK